ncbi:pilus assembly protein PilP [Paludibacterium sp. B53371]|uniref:pilus assembly protein PilP n=1 Tax=Paludibacterium sp. B53371 TaxID=2806263 RepID=UPI001C04EFEE|nr:pilus assembly protein PilP [Paludibacterium sp. B53371]
MRKLLCYGLLCGSISSQADPALRTPFDPQRLSTGKGVAGLPSMDADRFDLSQIKLAGTLVRGSKRLALLQDQHQQVYTVRVGSLLGHGHWQVTLIGESHIALKPVGEATPSSRGERYLHMETP